MEEHFLTLSTPDFYIILASGLIRAPWTWAGCVHCQALIWVCMGTNKEASYPLSTPDAKLGLILIGQ